MKNWKREFILYIGICVTSCVNYLLFMYVDIEWAPHLMFIWTWFASIAINHWYQNA